MTKRIPLTEWKRIPPTCSCEKCQSMCEVPCWPTPEEHLDLLARGYGNKMMVTERETEKGDRYITVISPAKRGRECKDNLDTDTSCVFQTEEGLCELHGTCKPLEGRLAICEIEGRRRGSEPKDLRDRIAELWDNPEAQKLVRDWVFTYGRRDYTWSFAADGSIFCYNPDSNEDD